LYVNLANHPLDPALREKGYQYNKPIHIGKNCWLGANVTVLPGVSIGEGSVIGANSLVTHDIPDHVLAYGSPCRIVRQIDGHDHDYFDHDQKIDPSLYK
jgi:galactoside O-acetyltransferase